MSDITLKKGIEIAKSGLTFPSGMKFEDWISTGKQLSTMNKSIHFWIGDWILYGEREFGEMYAQALDETSYVYGTLRNDKWVASRIPASRRHDNLSWSHHYEVADLEPEDQDTLLAEAEKQKLSVSKFRKLVYQKKIRLDLPEISDAELSKAQNPSKDFDLVQVVIDKGLSFLEALQGITVSSVEAGARDYLKSHLKDVIRIVGGTILSYEKQTTDSKEMGKQTQAKAKDAKKAVVL